MPEICAIICERISIYARIFGISLKGSVIMKKTQTSLIFTGDIGFDRYMNKKWEDENLFSKAVLDFFKSGDHTVANV